MNFKVTAIILVCLFISSALEAKEIASMQSLSVRKGTPLD